MKLNENPIRHWPFFCEENIWHLCQEPFLAHLERKVVFISNKDRRVAMKYQKAVALGSVVTWDYHVVLLYYDNGWKIADLDTLLALPCTAGEYLSHSFVSAGLPMFRVVDADHFIRYFASDRRHMLGSDGRYLKSVPPWSAISSESNLWDFVDMTTGDSHGQVYSLSEMHTAFT